MLKGMTKHEDKEHGKTLKHEASRSINHKATQNKNNDVRVVDKSRYENFLGENVLY